MKKIEIKKATIKTKLWISLGLFVLALIWELLFNRGEHAHAFSDIFIILCFLCLSILVNAWFSKWTKNPVPLMSDVVVNSLFIYSLIRLFVLALEAGQTEVVVMGGTFPTQSLCTFGICVAFLAMILLHYFFLIKVQHTWKRFALTVLYTFFVLLSIGLPLLARIAYEIAKDI